MRTPEQMAKYYATRKAKADAIALVAGRVPGRVGRPPVLTAEQKEERRIAQNKKISQRTLAKRTAERAARALAEGREPGKPGRKKVLLTVEQKAESLRKNAMKYKIANLAKVREANAAAGRAKRAARALAEGRVPGVLGHNAVLTAEQLAEYRAKWTEQERRFYFAVKTQNRRAAKRGIRGEITIPDIYRTLDAQGGCCAFCANPFGDEIPEIDQWLALSTGGTNEPENIRLLHRGCNRTKGAKHPESFGLSLTRIAAGA